MKSGKVLMDLIVGSCAAYLDHDENLSDQETELVGGFLQEISDWADLSSLLK